MIKSRGGVTGLELYQVIGRLSDLYTCTIYLNVATIHLNVAIDCSLVYHSFSHHGSYCMIFRHSLQSYLVSTQFYQLAFTKVNYSTTVTMVKIHKTQSVPQFYFIDKSIGYFNDMLTTKLEKFQVLI